MNKQKIQNSNFQEPILLFGLFENEYQETWGRGKTEAAIHKCYSK